MEPKKLPWYLIFGGLTLIRRICELSQTSGSFKSTPRCSQAHACVCVHACMCMCACVMWNYVCVYKQRYMLHPAPTCKADWKISEGLVVGFRNPLVQFHVPSPFSSSCILYIFLRFFVVQERGHPWGGVCHVVSMCPWPSGGPPEPLERTWPVIRPFHPFPLSIVSFTGSSWKAGDPEEEVRFFPAKHSEASQTIWGQSFLCLGFNGVAVIQGFSSTRASHVTSHKLPKSRRSCFFLEIT